MTMDKSTVQFLYRVMAGTICLCVLAFMGMMIAAVFVFRDGEGLKIIGDLTGPMMSAFAGMGVFLGLHQAANAWVAHATVTSGSSSTSGSALATAGTDQPSSGT